MAALTTFAYAFGSGFLTLLAARIGWGLAFAALNLTALVYAAASRDAAGRRVGLSSAIRQAARRRPDDTLRSFSVLATWGDLGEALGPLVAGSLSEAVSAQWLHLAMAAGGAAAALADHLRRHP